MAKIWHKYSGKKLTDKEREFADQYMVDLDGTKAAIRAGYKPTAAHVTASKILSKPHVKSYIASCLKSQHESLELTTKEVLQQLYYLVTRDVREFVDEDGVLLPLNELNDRAAMSVDGFDQEVVEYTDMNGERHKTVKNKLKLVSKAGAIDMAMKYYGLFKQDNEQKQNNVTIDFSKLFQPFVDTDDRVTKAMTSLEETTKEQLVIDVEPSGKPSIHNEDSSQEILGKESVGIASAKKMGKDKG